MQSQNTPVLVFNTPNQNNLQFNRFMMNPTFSFVNNSDSHITLYNRNQWIQFDNSPQLFMGSYSGKFTEKSGAGIGLYQQNSGIISSYGAIANYAYHVPFQEKMGLTLGFNLAYYSSGINKNKTITNDPDPIILALSNTSMLTLNPGMNFNWGSFDLGVYAENLVDYNFNSSNLEQDFSQKKYSGTLSYQYQMNATNGLFENGTLRLLARGSYNEEKETAFGGSLLSNFPSMGWIQGGFDNQYGIGVGGGVHLSKRISVGYVYEKGLKDAISSFGPTHEITISFRFPSKENAEVIPVKPVEKAKPIVEKPIQKEVKKDESFDKNVEIEKLKLQLDEKHNKLLNMLASQDSTENMNKADFDKRINNLLEYIQRLESTITQKEVKPESKKSETAKIEPKKEPVSKTSSTNSSPRVVEVLPASSPKTIETKEELPKSKPIENVVVKPLTDSEIESKYNTSESKKIALVKGNRLEIENVDAGYYLVANIYSKPAQAEDFLNELKLMGIYGNYFINPKNNYRYVYIKAYKSWEEALIAYYTNVNNTYFDKLWIMNINVN